MSLPRRPGAGEARPAHELKRANPVYYCGGNADRNTVRPPAISLTQKNGGFPGTVSPAAGPLFSLTCAASAGPFQESEIYDLSLCVGRLDHYMTPPIVTRARNAAGPLWGILVVIGAGGMLGRHAGVSLQAKSGVGGGESLC